jgi:tRNA uridine 5-carbamoylmethylation protein Kti12
MKIILLTGPPRSGKTTTLNMLYDTVTDNGKKNIEVPRCDIGAASDFECVLNYKNKKVEIFSAGDSYHECIKAIIAYANRDVLVLAYSTKFCRALDVVIKSYDFHCVVKKRRATDQDNERACKEILACIEP